MFKALKEGLSVKAKVVIALILVVFVAGGSLVAYKLWDYKENNPGFCMSCHLMKEAFDKWAVSEHKDVNCHECHHLTIKEQNMLLVNLVLQNPKEVPSRHGKVIVPWKYCYKCHVETDERYPKALKVNNSPFHAKHFFMVKLECSRCHGYKLHEFKPEPRFCISCHPKNEKVHGMPDLACVACHNDSAGNLRPERETCLACHGSALQRKKICAMMNASGCIKFQPNEAEAVKAARLAVFPEDGAMQFECYKCHKPHVKLLPAVEADCLPCHRNIKQIGKHPAHLDMGMKCLDCHKPHGWKVPKAMGKSKACTKCHGPVDPANFIK